MTNPERHRAHAGDLVILSYQQRLSMQDLEQISRVMRAQKPTGVQLLIVDSECRIHVARRSRTPRRGATPRWTRT